MEIFVKFEISDLEQKALEEAYSQKIEMGETIDGLISEVSKTSVRDFIRSAVNMYISRQTESVKSKIDLIADDAEKLSRIETAIDQEIQQEIQ